MQELVDAAKAKPNTMNYGSYGPGSQPHLLFESVAAILNDPDFKARFIDRAGHTGVGRPPAEFANFIAGDYAARKTTIEAAGIVQE